jgi:DNA-binding transcriptional regulator YiaG
MIKFYSHMVKPLRTELGMTLESFAYILGCGVRTIWHYEKNTPKKMKASIRDGMIRLMTKNGITTEDLGGES